MIQDGALLTTLFCVCGEFVFNVVGGFVRKTKKEAFFFFFGWFLWLSCCCYFVFL